MAKSSFDDTFTGLGLERLEMVIEDYSNAAKDLLDYNDKQAVLAESEYFTLTLARSRVPSAMVHLGRALKDQDFVAVIKLIEFSYAVGAYGRSPVMLPKVINRIRGKKGGDDSSIKSRANTWKRWRKKALKIAFEVWAQKSKCPDTAVARIIAQRFEGDELPNDKRVLKWLSVWRKRLRPDKKVIPL